MKHFEKFLRQNAKEIPPKTRAAIRHHIGHGNNGKAASLLEAHLLPDFRAAISADYYAKVEGQPFEADKAMYKEHGSPKSSVIMPVKIRLAR